MNTIIYTVDSIKYKCRHCLVEGSVGVEDMQVTSSFLGGRGAAEAFLWHLCDEQGRKRKENKLGNDVQGWASVQCLSRTNPVKEYIYKL